MLYRIKSDWATKEIKLCECESYQFWEDMEHIRNKRPMGHISYLRKQFKSINTYDYNVS